MVSGHCHSQQPCRFLHPASFLARCQISQNLTFGFAGKHRNDNLFALQIKLPGDLKLRPSFSCAVNVVENLSGDLRIRQGEIFKSASPVPMERPGGMQEMDVTSCLQNTLVVVLDKATRWNSTYFPQMRKFSGNRGYCFTQMQGSCLGGGSLIKSYLSTRQFKSNRIV
jgi:hypothetical protein